MPLEIGPKLGSACPIGGGSSLAGRNLALTLVELIADALVLRIGRAALLPQSFIMLALGSRQLRRTGFFRPGELVLFEFHLIEHRARLDRGSGELANPPLRAGRIGIGRAVDDADNLGGTSLMKTAQE